LADKYIFIFGERILGKTKISFDSEVHDAIKQLEKDSSTKNKEKVQKLILKR